MESRGIVNDAKKLESSSGFRVPNLFKKDIGFICLATD
jgi:hypothetical protein